MTRTGEKNLNIISPVNIKDRQSINIGPGDTVRVWQKIEEKGKTRLQAFEGIVLARKHGSEAGATFTVRKVSGGIGIEKIFPLYSPAIDKIEVIRRAKVRRSKLYHIRDKAAREIRRQMRNMKIVDISTESDMESKAKAEADEEAKKSKEAEESADKQEGGAEVKADDKSSEAEETKGSKETEEVEDSSQKQNESEGSEATEGQTEENNN